MGETKPTTLDGAWMDGVWMDGADGGFPAALTPQEPASVAAAAAWAGEHRQAIQNLLAAKGAVLFRGFGLETDTDFDQFIAAFDWPNFTYAESLSSGSAQSHRSRVYRQRGTTGGLDIFASRDGANTDLSVSTLLFLRAAGTQRWRNAYLPLGLVVRAAYR